MPLAHSPATIASLLVLLLLVIGPSVEAGKSRDKYRDKAPDSASSPVVNRTTGSVYYDQRQTGKYNINVNIKDVAIISIDPETMGVNVGDSNSDGDYYGDDDDYYDYDQDDFTVSPIAALLGGLTTKKPTKLPTIAVSNSTSATGNSTQAPATDLLPPTLDATTPEFTANHTAFNTTIEAITNSSSTATNASGPATAALDEVAPVVNVSQQTLPTFQENEIPVHIILDGEEPPSAGQMMRHRTRASAHGQGRRPSGSKYPKRRRQQTVRRHSNSHNSNSNRRNDVEDENGNSHQTAGRRVGMQKVMDLLTLLRPSVLKA